MVLSHVRLVMAGVSPRNARLRNDQIPPAEPLPAPPAGGFRKTPSGEPGCGCCTYDRIIVKNKIRTIRQLSPDCRASAIMIFVRDDEKRLRATLMQLCHR